MGKTYKRNSYFKPKKGGKVFEKKPDKWKGKKPLPEKISTEEFVPEIE
jgi:hypothetical protein